MASGKRVMIDWLSFTYPVEYGEEINHVSAIHEVENSGIDYLGDDWRILMTAQQSWTPCAGRRPYGQGFRIDEGIAIYYNTKLDTVLVEISGKGCDYLRSLGILDTMVSRMTDRISRIDIAVDIETETTVMEFVNKSECARFKSKSFVTSPTGDTQYIGSRTSERYCRVYRYAPPHPRSQYLRTEFVYRKENAKILAKRLVDTNFDLFGIAVGSGVIYGFEHPDFEMNENAIDMSSYTPERREGKTVMWLVSQVAPAFKKLVKSGVIDNPEAFIKEYFLDG